jgi:heme-degrading monooxygenase HmoA
MILEHALLPVRAGQSSAFEAAFESAREIISSMPGFIDLELSRGIESPSTYLLLVRWEDLEAHEKGFRGSPQYQRWSDLLHHFYDPFPVVEHFARVVPTEYS